MEQTPAASPSDSPPSPELASLPAILSTPELLAYLGITRPTLCEWRRRGAFPRPFRCSSQRFAWKVSEVEQWLQSRPRG